MTTTEWLVIAAGLVLGYGVVSLLMGQPARRARPDDARPAGQAGEAGRAAQDTAAEHAAPPPPPSPPPAAAPEHWSAVLGVPPSAPSDEIRQAYRRRMSQYHPDKVATLGEELQALALRKSQAIEAAYRQALAERGEGRGCP